MSVWGQRVAAMRLTFLGFSTKVEALFSDNVGQTAEYVDFGDGASPRVQASRGHQLWA